MDTLNKLEYFSLNGEIKLIKKAHISIKNIEYSYGYGVYETLKARKKRNNIFYGIAYKETL